MELNEPESVLFDEGGSLIQWRKPGEGTFFFVESKQPAGFRVACVTSEGKPANLVATTVGASTFPAGQFFRAQTSKAGQPVLSPLYGSVPEAKNACEHFRREGDFPHK